MSVTYPCFGCESDSDHCFGAADVVKPGVIGGYICSCDCRLSDEQGSMHNSRSDITLKDDKGNLVTFHICVWCSSLFTSVEDHREFHHLLGDERG